jgi:predicted TIM-barrel fold metal-dependent hydrolase
MRHGQLTSAGHSSGRRRFLQFGTALAAGTALAQFGASAQVGAPQRIAIDLHAHWTPEPYAKAMADLGRPTFANGTVLNPLMYDLPRRLEWMEKLNIQTHVLTLSGNMPWWWASEADAVRLAQLVNDAALEAHAKYPDRFLVGVAVPIKHPDAALN